VLEIVPPLVLLCARGTIVPDGRLVIDVFRCPGCPSNRGRRAGTGSIVDVEARVSGPYVDADKPGSSVGEVIFMEANIIGRSTTAAPTVAEAISGVSASDSELMSGDMATPTGLLLRSSENEN